MLSEKFYYKFNS